MKDRMRMASAALLLALAAVLPALGEETGRFALAPESRLWLEGDSTLHPYSSTATQITAAGETSGAESAPEDVLKAGAVKSFQLTVPVRGLKSGKGGLDENLYKALKAKDHPDILFRLRTLSAEPSPEGVFRVRADGVLSVAGQEKDVTLEADARVQDGRLRIRGKEELRMTDFGVKPPSMMLGAVRTRDEVTVHYEISLDVK